VVWAQTETAPGACGNGPGRERERKAIQARASNGAQTGRERRCKWEDVDNMWAPTSTGYAEGRARTTCRHQLPLGAQTGGHEQHAGANVHWVCGWEGVDGRAYT
jgi:hypothetical protein